MFFRRRGVLKRKSISLSLIVMNGLLTFMSNILNICWFVAYWLQITTLGCHLICFNFSKLVSKMSFKFCADVELRLR